VAAADISTSARCGFALLAAFALVAMGGPRGSFGASWRAHSLPGGITSDCSRDVTRAISSWIASVPNGSLLAFPNHGCFRINGTIELPNRGDLELEGNGAVFRSFGPSVDERSMWRIIDSKNIGFHDMAIDGSYKKGGRFTARLQHAHGIEAHGSSLDISGVTITDVPGDCFFLGGGYTSALALSSGARARPRGRAKDLLARRAEARVRTGATTAKRRGSRLAP